MGHKMTEAGCDITVTAANDEELARFRSYVASLGFNKGLIYAPPDTSLLNGNVVTILAALKQKQLTPDEVKAYINAETRGNGRGTILKYLQGLL
jgi:formate/nitrite transporter FocA (FNT family)